ncbi:S8 family peptidase [Amycolatopsis rubida]|uniref:Subtilase family protein n=1 Tax=Amycolatopsis rubida TaxID=112413 RepID=A0A1I5SLC8_9PSEU|nr:S8 family serine peptidase [Amycolatopsis rubida]SFP71560.1 Subtilase family protein [Amycolatopsis rubida]
MSLARTPRIAVVVLALSLGATSASLGSVSAAAAAPPGHPPRGEHASSTVTLITGDKVISYGHGKYAVEPGPGRDRIAFRAFDRAGHAYVIPSDAQSLVAAGSVDKRLFDVAGLRRSGYADSDSDQLPLIVTGGRAAARSGARVRRELPSIGGVAVKAEKSRVDQVWNSVTAAAGGGRVLRSGVERVWLDGRRQTLGGGARQIGAPRAWGSGVTGEGVKVAVLDTGVDATHPDLQGRVTGQRNFSDAADNVDRNGHGTRAAGIIAGTGAFAGGEYQGIAHGAQILDGKVLDDAGSGRDSDIIAGMQWAAGQRADIVTLGVGVGAPEADPLEEAVDSLSAKTGTLFVVAAGNGGPSEETVKSPGSADAALTVGAVNGEGGLAESSVRGPRFDDGAIEPDVIAPGTAIGTAHVAGAAALVAKAHPDLRGQQLKALLIASAKPEPKFGAFERGPGRIDVPAALARQVVTAPAKLGFGVQSWPHEDDKPVSKPLSYRNDSTADVTLKLSVRVTGPDGKPAPEGMFSLDQQQVTIPGGETAKVNVTSDTRLGSLAGGYSGQVVASSTTAEIVTPLAVTREAESYDLTVAQLGPDGKPVPPGTSSADVLGIDSQLWKTVPPEGKIRLPKGRYTVLASQISGGQDVRHYELVEPAHQLTENAVLTFDARQAKPIKVNGPDPAAKAHTSSVGFSQVMGALPARYSLVTKGPLDKISTVQVGPDAAPDVFAAHISSQSTGKKGEYNFAWFAPGRYPTGFRRDVRQKDLAQVQVEFGAPDAVKEGARSVFPGQADGIGSVNLEVYQPVAIPGSRTEFYSTGATRWSGVFAEQGTVKTVLESPPKTYRAGKRYHERFNVGPFGPGLPESMLGPPWAERINDDIWADIPMFTDGAGNAGTGDTKLRGHTTLHRGDKLVGQNETPGHAVFTVGPEPGRYRLGVEVDQPSESGVSTHQTVAWCFGSAHVDGRRTLPLTAIRFTPQLDLTSSAPAGQRLDVPVFLQGVDGGPVPYAWLTVQVSYDEGKNWADAPVIGGKVTLAHPPDASSVSLRGQAEGQGGNTVEQTILRAYKLKR